MILDGLMHKRPEKQRNKKSINILMIAFGNLDFYEEQKEKL
jgi:hypothetical protein